MVCTSCLWQVTVWLGTEAHSQARGASVVLAGVLRQRQFRDHLSTFLKDLLNMVLHTQSYQWNPSPPFSGVGNKCTDEQSALGKIVCAFLCLSPAGAEGPKIIFILSLYPSARVLPAAVNFLGVEPSEFWDHQSLLHGLFLVLLSPGMYAAVLWITDQCAGGRRGRGHV